MSQEPVQVASITDAVFTWFSPEQLIFALVTYVVLFVLVKKDRFT